MKVSRKKWEVTLILCFILGYFGIHRFYVRKKGTAILWLFTFGCLGIGWLFDIVSVCSGKFRDANGAYILSKKQRLRMHSQPKRTPALTQYQPIPESDSTSTLDVRVPRVIGKEYLCYHYTKVRFSPNEYTWDIAEQMQRLNSWELSINMVGDNIQISFQGQSIGILLDRIDMVRDWLNRGDTLKIWLENCGDSGYFVFLAFYRDEKKRLAHREQSVVKLIKYTDNGTNYLELFPPEEGAMFDFDEDRDDENIYISDGVPLGRLPKRYAERYLNEGAAAVFCERIDCDDNGNTVVFVRIYW